MTMPESEISRKEVVTYLHTAVGTRRAAKVLAHVIKRLRKLPRSTPMTEAEFMSIVDEEIGEVLGGGKA